LVDLFEISLVKLKLENMKNSLVLFFFLFLVSSKAQEIAKIENIKINSKELQQEREILIYTPQSYNENLKSSVV